MGGSAQDSRDDGELQEVGEGARPAESAGEPHPLADDDALDEPCDVTVEPGKGTIARAVKDGHHHLCLEPGAYTSPTFSVSAASHVSVRALREGVEMNDLEVHGKGALSLFGFKLSRGNVTTPVFTARNMALDHVSHAVSEFGAGRSSTIEKCKLGRFGVNVQFALAGRGRDRIALQKNVCDRAADCPDMLSVSLVPGDSPLETDSDVAVLIANNIVDNAPKVGMSLSVKRPPDSSGRVSITLLHNTVDTFDDPNYGISWSFESDAVDLVLANNAISGYGIPLGDTKGLASFVDESNWISSEPRPAWYDDEAELPRRPSADSPLVDAASRNYALAVDAFEQIRVDPDVGAVER